MVTVTLYSREDCHLCEQAYADLQSLQDELPHRIKVVDVDSTKELQKEYGFEVPVVEIGPYKLRPPFGVQELRVTLSAAIDRQRHIDLIENSPALDEVRQGGVWTGADRFTYWLSRHYLALLNIIVFLYLGASFLAPVLLKAGASTPAALLYRAYSIVCHQLAYRSFFLFGEQIAYPRAAAGVPGLLTYNQATGLSEDSTAAAQFAARDFVGDERLGYKIALCQRDVGIYAGILFFGLLFGALGRRFPIVPWYVWVLFGMVPIAVDGFSQLLSQPPFSFWAFRESTPQLRLLTGGLFGFFTAWFGYPMVEETMADSRQLMESKLRRIQRLTST